MVTTPIGLDFRKSLEVRRINGLVSMSKRVSIQSRSWLLLMLKPKQWEQETLSLSTCPLLSSVVLLRMHITVHYLFSSIPDRLLWLRIQNLKKIEAITLPIGDGNFHFVDREPNRFHCFIWISDSVSKWWTKFVFWVTTSGLESLG